MQDRPHVIVIGAGFGGLAVARELVDQPVDVTVVDRNNFHTFLPLLYQVATSGLNAADVAHSVRAVFQKADNVQVRLGTVTGVDWDTRSIEIEDQQPLAFDHLVVAAGSSTNYFGVPGAAEHAFPLYSITDAVALRNRIIEQFEAADREPALIDEGALSFVIVGGGPTGVELSGAMAELFDRVLRKDFSHLPVDRARVVLVEMSDSLLTPFQKRSRRHAIDALRRRGVDVRLATRVESVAADDVVLDGGERVPTRTLIWAAGVQASPLTAVLDVDLGPGGRVVVDDDLSIRGRPGGWALGDVAHVTSADGAAVPQLAPAAMQGGRLVAQNIVRSVEGRPTEAFAYRNKGTMATIGRRSAVTEIPHLPPLVGSVAWLAWLVLHLYMLIGFRNRVSVLVNWAWNYLTWDRGPRILLRSGK
ncbi:NAD(P)/FAD-dependent oxidoreductase [Actinospongicola halichondriae]|uniref:NAD(P)/FAD-dependent oxidoreductase n=1 Tax=Actinospongicola halichondriae TaxID=3236844 RepID=UPI003D392A1F